MRDFAQMRDAVVQIRRTHMRDPTPLTLGQEWSGYAAILDDGSGPIEDAHWRKRASLV